MFVFLVMDIKPTLKLNINTNNKIVTLLFHLSYTVFCKNKFFWIVIIIISAHIDLNESTNLLFLNDGPNGVFIIIDIYNLG